jgi:glycine/sarcosine N-methyltransferase/sarcosine/dimethylglycine N-methyltransferase
MPALSGDHSRWERRLAREIPFLTRFFEETGVKRVLDVACARGRHAVSLAEQGYDVTGVDIEAESIEKAREHASERGFRIDFHEGDYLELGRVAPGPFDGLFCVGNALSFCQDESDMLKALGQFRQVLRPGGVAIAQILNYQGISERGEELDFVRSYGQGEDEHVVVKFFRFDEPRWNVEFATLRRAGESWEAELGRGSLLPIRADLYRELWQRAGFAEVQLFGDYAATPFDVHTARDAIAVARTPA